MNTFWRRRGPVVLGLVVVAALVTVFLVLRGGSGANTAAPPLTTSSATAVPGGDAPQSGPVLPKSDPVSLDIPKIGAHSSLVSLGLNADNTVQVPPVSTPLQAGWYSNGPTPGEIGPAVILGHVDGNKHKGIFYRLKELAPGDEVSVARKDGSTAKFVVTKVDDVPKTTFPTDAVYGDTDDAELRLITCGGSFDHAAHSYRDNIIVYAHLVQ